MLSYSTQSFDGGWVCNIRMGPPPQLGRTQTRPHQNQPAHRIQSTAPNRNLQGTSCLGRRAIWSRHLPPQLLSRRPLRRQCLCRRACLQARTICLTTKASAKRRWQLPPFRAKNSRNEQQFHQPVWHVDQSI